MKMTVKQQWLLIAAIFVIIEFIQLGDRIFYGWGYPPIEQLFIDEKAFPPGWIAEEIDTDFPPLAPCSTGREEIEYATRSFYSNPPSGYVGSASILLQRYRNPSVASKIYTRTVTSDFHNSDSNAKWVKPVDFTFTSPYADKYEYSCRIDGSQISEISLCAYTAQYEVYVIEFSLGLNDTNVNAYEDFALILEAIDRKMSQVK